MSSRLGSVSTYFNNYFESHTPKDEEFLKPVERARTARYMDYAGRIPFLGMGFGLIRMIGSLAIGMIALIGKMLTKETKDGPAFKYWEHLKARAGGELCRGGLELAAFGFLNFVLNREGKKMESNSKGVLIPFSRGRYVYFREGDHFYSNTRFEGNAKRHEGDMYDDSGTELRFNEAAIQAAETGSTELRYKNLN